MQAKLATACWIITSIAFGVWQNSISAGVLWFFGYLLVLTTVAAVVEWKP